MLQKISLIINSKKVYSHSNQLYFYSLIEEDLKALRNIGLELEIKEKFLLLLRDYNSNKMYILFLYIPTEEYDVYFNILSTYSSIYEIEWSCPFRITDSFSIYNLYNFFKNYSIDKIIIENLYVNSEGNIQGLFLKTNYKSGILAVDEYLNKTILKNNGDDNYESR